MQEGLCEVSCELLPDHTQEELELVTSTKSTAPHCKLQHSTHMQCNIAHDTGSMPEQPAIIVLGRRVYHSKSTDIGQLGAAHAQTESKAAPTDGSRGCAQANSCPQDPVSCHEANDEDEAVAEADKGQGVQAAGISAQQGMLIGLMSHFAVVRGPSWLFGGSGC